jgi:hypothetical protein
MPNKQSRYELKGRLVQILGGREWDLHRVVKREGQERGEHLNLVGIFNEFRGQEVVITIETPGAHRARIRDVKKAKKAAKDLAKAEKAAAKKPAKAEESGDSPAASPAEGEPKAKSKKSKS